MVALLMYSPSLPQPGRPWRRRSGWWGTHLRQQFPEETVDHLPKPDQMADLFRVISAYQPRHQLLIRRRFFDDQIPDVAALRDVLAGITERMRRAGGETYIELN